MKSLRNFFAVTLLVLTLGLPAFADGQMETPKPQGAPVTVTDVPTALDGQMETPQSRDGQMETPLMIALRVIENVLALI